MKVGDTGVVIVELLHQERDQTEWMAPGSQQTATSKTRSMHREASIRRGGLGPPRGREASRRKLLSLRSVRSNE